MKTLTILSTGRHDWAILKPLAERLAQVPDLSVLIQQVGLATRLPLETYIVSGARTCDVIQLDTYQPLSVQAAEAMTGWAVTEPTDWLVVVGDRAETAAIVLAAVAEGTKVVHLHGGEATLGAVDDTFRHAITACSDLHLVAHEDYAAKVVSQGADPDMVHVVGAIGAEQCLAPIPSRRDTLWALRLRGLDDYALLCVHPETRGDDPVAATQLVANACMVACDALHLPVVLLEGNRDGDGAEAELREWAINRHHHTCVQGAFTPEAYRGVLAHAAVALGNSSSLCLEAPIYGTPTVIVGTRQTGRPYRGYAVDAHPVAVTQAVGHAIETERTPTPDWLHARGALERSVRVIVDTVTGSVS